MPEPTPQRQAAQRLARAAAGVRDARTSLDARRELRDAEHALDRLIDEMRAVPKPGDSRG